eukprot:scaffold16511_cov67-Cyclotella_meneghiniana.AAC.7
MQHSTAVAKNLIWEIKPKMPSTSNIATLITHPSFDVRLVICSSPIFGFQDKGTHQQDLRTSL